MLCPFIKMDEDISCDALLTLQKSTTTVWVSVSHDNFASGKRWQHRGLALVKCLG
jgi:hypothetical protein